MLAVRAAADDDEEMRNPEILSSRHVESSHKGICKTVF